MAPGRCRPDPSDAAAAPPLAMKTEGSHQASSSRSVLAPRRIAVCSTSPVSPALAIDHFPSLGWSPLYWRRISGLWPKPPAANRTPLRASTFTAHAVTDDARTHDPAVFDDEILHGGVGPQRWLRRR